MAQKKIYKLKRAFAEEVEKGFKLLLEEKHLYQSTRIPKEKLIQNVQEVLDSVSFEVEVPSAEQLVESLLCAYWSAENPADTASKLYGGFNQEPFEYLDFKIVSIKTYCGNCGEFSPMNLKKTTDAISGIWDKTGFSTDDDHSVYTFTFQCQNCREGMEVFAVARKRRKLTLVGRSPMEKVQIPNDIPKEHEEFYSGAIIAYNSGQVLPALFMLRTLIEQYTREITGNSSGLADEVLEEYMTGLPNDFKSRFPSLKKVYSELSDAIHKANSSEQLFNESREKIERHFEAKRIFEL